MTALRMRGKPRGEFLKEALADEIGPETRCDNSLLSLPDLPLSVIVDFCAGADANAGMRRKIHQIVD